MKILISYGFKKPYPPIGIFCSNAFSNLGHKVILFNSRIENPIYKKINKLLKNSNLKIDKLDHKERINNLLIKKVLSSKPDILLDIGGRFLFPQTLRKIKNISDIKLILWATERSFDVEDEDFLKEIEVYDYIFSTSNYAVRTLEEKGMRNIYYLPFATDINYYKKLFLLNGDLNRYGCEIGFVGAYDKNREKILENLIEFDLKIYGTEWDKATGTNLKQFLTSTSGLYGKNLIRFYNAVKININISKENYNRNLSGMDLRIFDIPACQSFLITQYVEEIPFTFEVGKEIEIFNDIEELKSKIKFYLNNENERNKISQRGYEKICKFHTFEKRMQEMLSFINPK